MNRNVIEIAELLQEKGFTTVNVDNGHADDDVFPIAQFIELLKMKLYPWVCGTHYFKVRYLTKDKLNLVPKMRDFYQNRTSVTVGQVTFTRVQTEMRDQSDVCGHSLNKDGICWRCTQFVFPIGCMKGER